VQVTLYKGVWLAKLGPQVMNFVSHFPQVPSFLPAQIFLCLGIAELIEQTPPAATTLLKTGDEEEAEIAFQILQSLLSYRRFLHEDSMASNPSHF